MLSQRPLVRQTQELRLKMSLQTVQTLKLLAQSTMDLKASIQEALEMNPALEVRDEPWEVSLDQLREKDESDDLLGLLRPDSESPVVDEALDRDVPHEPLVPEGEVLPSEHEEAFQTFSEDPGYYDSAGATDLGRAAPRDSIHTIIENTLTAGTDLRSYLMEQLTLQKISEKVRKLAERLIQNLDGNGFHIVPPEQLLRATESPADLGDSVDLVQGFDPVGTCTIDWRESLLVQMKIHGGFSDEAVALVRDYASLLLEGKEKAIAQALKVPLNEVDIILDEIRTLNPFPGRAHTPSGAVDIIPDLILEERDGEPVLTFNDDALPVLGINPHFYAESSDASLDRSTRIFVKSKVREAQWFIQSVLYRQSTLVKVGFAVCRRQIEFLRKGLLHLKPLVLSEIAEEVGLHPSTISRATNGKYIQTKWGIIELKDFFTRNSGKGDASKQSIKEMIRVIVSEMKSKKKITDQVIRERLADRGVEIALRTVNKYRNEMETEQ